MANISTASSSNFISYQNTTYLLEISLESNKSAAQQTLLEVLDNSGIESLRYETQLNNLLVSGKISYLDQYSKIDRFLDQQYVTCTISFGQVVKKSDGSVDENKIDPAKHVLHRFIVQSIKPVERIQSRIKYEIDIVSSYWHKCNANIAYSNYNDAEQSLFDILKACMSIAKLPFDAESFDKVTTDVKMDYLSTSNDTLSTIFKYLMHKLYFLPTKDTSLKYMMFDILQRQYKLLDASQIDNGLEPSSTVLSFFKSNAEALVLQEPTNLGAFINGATSTDLYSSIFDSKMYAFDYGQNKFNVIESSSEMIAKYINNNVGESGYVKRYQDYSDSMPSHYHVDSYWSSKMDVYDNTFNAIVEGNALVLNIAGDIQRQPGSFVTIGLDRDMNAMTSDSRADLEKMKIKYKVFEGLWIASRVINIIEPQASRYRQQVALFKNFTMDRKPAVVLD